MSPPPASKELWSNPELAVLHVLASALAAAERTLVAAHPELEEDRGTDVPERFSGIAGLANVLVAHITETASALERYTAQVRQDREREPHFPF